MNPLPPFERLPDENENHEKPTWPWEETPKDQEADAKDKERKKKPERLKREKTKEKSSDEKAKKEEKTEKKDEKGQKRERRISLIEQSIALVAKYEEEPVPRDATVLARVMIAHRVVQLHKQLEHPEQFKSELSPEEVEATLDYIAHLDEKFQDPTSEAVPEIEASYKEILKLAETTLKEEPDLEQVVVRLDTEQINSDITTTSGQRRSADEKVNKPRQNLDQTQAEFERRKRAVDDIFSLGAAAALIYVITRAGRKKTKIQPQEITSAFRDGNDREIINTDTPSAEPISTLPKPQLISNGMHIESTVSSQRGVISQPERSTPAISTRERISVPVRHSSPALAATAVATTLAAGRTPGEYPVIPRTETVSSGSNPSSYETRVPQPEQKSSFAPENASAGPKRKIEHMSLLQLLHMAENVSIGHGHYLRRAFEAGQIDKEGLMKILKAHAKGRDHQFEYRQQAAKFAKLKATSPEFLHPTHQRRNQTEEQAAEPSEPPEKMSEESPIKQPAAPVHPLSLAPPTTHELLPELAESAHPQHIGRRLLLITLAAFAGLALIGWLAMSIFSVLS